MTLWAVGHSPLQQKHWFLQQFFCWKSGENQLDLGKDTGPEPAALVECLVWVWGVNPSGVHRKGGSGFMAAFILFYIYIFDLYLILLETSVIPVSVWRAVPQQSFNTQCWPNTAAVPSGKGEAQRGETNPSSCVLLSAEFLQEGAERASAGSQSIKTINTKCCVPSISLGCSVVHLDSAESQRRRHSSFVMA